MGGRLSPFSSGQLCSVISSSSLSYGWDGRKGPIRTRSSLPSNRLPSHICHSLHARNITSSSLSPSHAPIGSHALIMDIVSPRHTNVFSSPQSYFLFVLFCSWRSGCDCVFSDILGSSPVVWVLDQSASGGASGNLLFVTLSFLAQPSQPLHTCLSVLV
jgi:hypothetical protein